ncbi:MAG: hypothetical protein NTW86_20345 [Candidatus Sumerlaeota bacterium]|nr:hypothetical protein [Candidatus Sumerlaeota bacterium]
MPNLTSQRAFTFVEALAAMVFVGVLVPIAIQGALVAGRVGEAAERREKAAYLADRVLTEAVVTGTWQSGAQSGDCGTDWPDYRWTLETSDWTTEPGLILVTATVFYKVQSKEYAARLSTLVEEATTQ